jgi:hypothetical protein
MIWYDRLPRAYINKSIYIYTICVTISSYVHRRCNVLIISCCELKDISIMTYNVKRVRERERERERAYYIMYS